MVHDLHMTAATSNWSSLILGAIAALAVAPATAPAASVVTYVDDGEISQVLQRHVTPDEQCEELIESAVRAGARDDATALVARYRIPAGDHDTP